MKDSRDLCQVLLDQTISSGTPVDLPILVLLRGRTSYPLFGLQIAWFGTLAGTWSQLNVSSSYGIDPVNAAWTPLVAPDPLAVFMAAGGAPNGAAGSAFIDATSGAAAVQLQFTRNGGSGRLWVVATPKLSA